MATDERYCAFIADIVKSSKMSDLQRFEAQEQLQDAIDMYNKKCEATIAAKIYFSQGDQLQALFNDAMSAYKFACDFREKLYPIEFRIGLGVGNWSLCYPGDNTNKQDGTSYRNARTAYEYAKNQHRRIAFHSSRDDDMLINTLIIQEYAIFNLQSSQQKEVFKTYKDVYPINPRMKKDNGVTVVHVDRGSQAQVAYKMGTSRQNVNKIVRTGLVYEQRDLQGSILLMLSRLFDVEGEKI